MLSWDEIANLVINALTPEERNSSAVYLDQRLLPTDEGIEIDGRQVRPSWRAAMAFVDLEPGVNWGHRCRYYLVNVDSGEIKAFNGQFPPFLTTPSPELRVICRGPDVPSWALAVPQ